MTVYIDASENIRIDVQTTVRQSGYVGVLPDDGCETREDATTHGTRVWL